MCVGVCVRARVCETQPQVAPGNRDPTVGIELFLDNAGCAGVPPAPSLAELNVDLAFLNGSSHNGSLHNGSPDKGLSGKGSSDNESPGKGSSASLPSDAHAPLRKDASLHTLASALALEPHAAAAALPAVERPALPRRHIGSVLCPKATKTPDFQCGPGGRSGVDRGGDGGRSGSDGGGNGKSLVGDTSANMQTVIRNFRFKAEKLFESGAPAPDAPLLDVVERSVGDVEAQF